LSKSGMWGLSIAGMTFNRILTNNARRNNGETNEGDEMTPTEGDIIRAERARERQYEADQIHITAHYCQMCGCKLNAVGKCDSNGCNDNSVTAAVIATSAPLVKTWTLLTMARLASPETWYSGQSVWLVPGKAFLKEGAGWVRLHIVGEGRSLPIYIFSPLAGWVEVVGLDRHFAEWIKE